MCNYADSLSSIIFMSQHVTTYYILQKSGDFALTTHTAE